MLSGGLPLCFKLVPQKLFSKPNHRCCHNLGTTHMHPHPHLPTRARAHTRTNSAKKIPELPKGSRILLCNYDVGERYLSVEGLF
jgi:hypothetical protein